MEKIGTKAVHSGERKRNRENRSVTISTEQTAAYYFKDTQQIIDFHQGKLKGVKYGRYGCPTQHAVEEKMADLDGGNRALAFASGMSAITTSILALLKNGDHLVFVGDCYRNTRRFFLDILPRYGIQSTEIQIGEDINRCIKKTQRCFSSRSPRIRFLELLILGKRSIFSRRKK